MDSLFTYAGASGPPPLGSKQAKALAWLRATNKDLSLNPLAVLGKIVEPLMDGELDPHNEWHTGKIQAREKLGKVLTDSGLQYVRGGLITSGLGTPTKTLSDYIRTRNYAAIDLEFQRALENVESKPREAVSAASNILESVCRVLIEDDGLPLPSKQDIQGLWGVVRKQLGLDPGVIQDKDLQQILTGIISIVHGIGSLRTHASSAHGAGKTVYRLQPRHARLAVHSAHTVALFILESWQHKRAATVL